MVMGDFASMASVLNEEELRVRLCLASSTSLAKPKPCQPFITPPSLQGTLVLQILGHPFWRLRQGEGPWSLAGNETLLLACSATLTSYAHQRCTCWS